MHPPSVCSSVRSSFAVPRPHASLRHQLALSTLVASTLVVSTLLTSSPAQACGGFFCSAVQPTPVDQNAERILFEVHPPPEGITAVVEISYTGDPSAFSWIVPVPETPVLDVVPAETLRVLDAITGPRVQPPPTTCNPPQGGLTLFGRATEVSAAAPEPSAAPEDDGVLVEELPNVGAFEPEVISSDDPDALINWLNDNDYLITEAMEPFVAQYVGEGYKFLGLKLAPDQGVADISPIKFTCPNGDMPLVPIRLTGVSAEPEMGILTFIAANERYAPQNYRELTVNADDVQWDYNTRTSNYYTLVSHLVDEEGGKAFVTQYAGSTEWIRGRAGVASIANPGPTTQQARDYVAGLEDRFSYLTRLYTRMGGWEMTDDPVFAPASLSDVDRVIDLSDREPVELCAEGVNRDTLHAPCGDTYCGVGGQCALLANGREGCVCPQGTTARRIQAPVGRSQAMRQTVTCQDASLNLLPTDEIGDICENRSCGEGGSCIAVNGFPTCRCDDGYAARATGSAAGTVCAPIVETFGVEQLKFSNTGLPTSVFCTCSSLSSTTWASGFGVLFLLGVMCRRRRR